MLNIERVATIISGTPQFRITEDPSGAAPVYTFYSQADLDDDLCGLSAQKGTGKQIATFDTVVTASEGAIVFSLLSGTAAIVHADRHGYLLTQNYVALVPFADVDARFLVYLLNENRLIRHQLRLSQQGSIVKKYAISQLKGLSLPELPPRAKQELIGEVYFDQLRLEALRKRVSELETALVLAAIREA